MTASYKMSCLQALWLFLLATITLQQNDPTTDDSAIPQDTAGSALYGGLVLPHVRQGTSFNTSSDAVCGGTQRGKVHFITSQMLDSEFKWYIETPYPDSMCLLRISEQVDQENQTGYANLIPLGRTDVQQDGFFPCGRKSGVENEFFDIPDEIDCDTCILEWIWRGSNFLVRQCADITVMGFDDMKCLGQCQNGGVCKRGVCECPPGYSGTHCEHTSGILANTARNILKVIFFILLAIILILLIILCLYWIAKKRISAGERDQIYHTNKKYVEFDLEMPNQPKGVDKPAEHVRAESQSEY